MTTWYIDTTKGDFMDHSLKSVIKKVTEYYIDNEGDFDTITNISSTEDGELFQQLPKQEVITIEYQIHQEVREALRMIEQEQEAYEELQRNYYSNLI